MVKKVILGSLLSMAVVLMGGTAAFAGTPPAVPPASCAAHCATYFGGSGQDWSVSASAKLGLMGGPDGIARMTDNCGDCCDAWVYKFTPSE